MKKVILIDSPSTRGKIEAALDEHWRSIEAEIHERRRMRDGDLTECDWDLLLHLATRNARRRRELGLVGGTWPTSGGAS